MPNITIEGKEYDLDSLSIEAKAQLAHLLHCDKEIADVSTKLAVLQTARKSYGTALSELLD